MTTTLPAIVTERKSKSEILTDLWKKICNKLYVPVHSMNEVTSIEKANWKRKNSYFRSYTGCLGNSIRSIKLIKKEKRMMNF